MNRTRNHRKARGSRAGSTSAEKSNSLKSRKVTVNTKCATCVGIILENDGCIECEKCFRWYHSQCVGIINKELLELFANRPGAHWLYTACDRINSRIAKIEVKVDKIQ